MNESSTPRWHDLQRRLAETFGTEANSNPPIGAKSRNSLGAAASSQSWLARAQLCRASEPADLIARRP